MCMLDLIDRRSNSQFHRFQYSNGFIFGNVRIGNRYETDDCLFRPSLAFLDIYKKLPNLNRVGKRRPFLIADSGRSGRFVPLDDVIVFAKLNPDAEVDVA